MEIKKTQHSKLDTIDPNNSPFGVNISDHMLICEYENGQWGKPVIMPYGGMNYSPALMAIHYGQAIFEGMKAYKDKNNDVFLFRPEKNFERFNKSAERLAMPPITKEIFLEGLYALIDLDRDWVPTKDGSSLYIRPTMFASEEMFSARISNKYTFAIMTSPADSYYDKPLKIKIENHYTRAVSGGVGFTKCAGNYGASFYPTLLANQQGFDQIIWTDSQEHKYFEESGTMNVMVRIGDIIYTPPVSNTILNGVTRDSLVNVARHNKIEVREERISVDSIVNAYQQGTLKEIFGCGTAVVVNRYSHVGYNDNIMELPTLKDEESYAVLLKKQLVGIQTNELDDPFGWRIKI
ncbi:branched-chain amino acid aminotransferase [Apibacter muscae]|uniref:branched-chain amino acid aminotransferase n=1 Tax=Apibacter muscae TaxID=2509004 RepID=UPI0011AD36F8|nr:branched-chain amino acid aminotransferase [Apibacter muscae]TWP24060.1 branched-chain amino acid aminotransferase [Apibacter muscae]